MRTIVPVLFIALGACGGEGTAGPVQPPPDPLRVDALAAGLEALPTQPPRPVENELNDERVALGHLLFFDPILSGPKDVACSTCHLPDRGFADGRQFAVGAGGSGLGPDRSLPAPPLRPMPRNSPTILNTGLYGRRGTAPSTNGTMFWGGTAFGLEDQVLNPISSDKELRGLAYEKAHAIDSVLVRLRGIGGYLDRFEAAFPALQSLANDPDRLVTTTTLRRALAAYLRELNTPQAPIDRFLRGDDAALGADQRRGLALFVGAAGCVQCHAGPLFSDFDMHVLGVAQQGLGRDTTPGEDLGWGESGGVRYAFRTPPLRQVTLTAPYFHAGTAPDLEAVLTFKSLGTSAHPKVTSTMLDPAVGPLELSGGQIDDLVAFMHALTDETTTTGPLFIAPDSVPSGLEVPR